MQPAAFFKPELDFSLGTIGMPLWAQAFKGGKFFQFFCDVKNNYDDTISVNLKENK